VKHVGGVTAGHHLVSGQVSSLLPQQFLQNVLCLKLRTKLNSVARLRQRTIPTDRPLLFREVNANFLRIEGAIAIFLIRWGLTFTIALLSVAVNSK
jgi:hypothetical protein